MEGRGKRARVCGWWGISIAAVNCCRRRSCGCESYVKCNNLRQFEACNKPSSNQHSTFIHSPVNSNFEFDLALTHARSCLSYPILTHLPLTNACLHFGSLIKILMKLQAHKFTHVASDLLSSSSYSSGSNSGSGSNSSSSLMAHNANGRSTNLLLLLPQPLSFRIICWREKAATPKNQSKHWQSHTVFDNTYVFRDWLIAALWNTPHIKLINQNIFEMKFPSFCLISSYAKLTGKTLKFTYSIWTIDRQLDRQLMVKIKNQ